MAGGVIYCLKGQGALDPVWVRECLALFKNRAVNIRKLVLLKNDQPEAFAVLEIVFALPVAESGEEPCFLLDLERKMAQQSWHEQSVLPV